METPSSTITIPNPIPKPPIVAEPALSVTNLASLGEETVWSLRKSELRRYFLALQSYVRTGLPLNPLPAPVISIPPTSLSLSLASLPPLLRLPLEIRYKIYASLLQGPFPDQPFRGPHPRQLQLPLSFSQSFPLAFLLVCKQLYNEAIPIFYGSADQTLNITINYDLWTYTGERSSLRISQAVIQSIRHVRLVIFLGSEKKKNKPSATEAEGRLVVVKKGVRKMGRWFGGPRARIQTLTVDWREPPLTFTWEQKREVLDELRVLSPSVVKAGEINWGLQYPGRRYRFETEYLKELRNRIEKENVCGMVAKDVELIDACDGC
ncbi:hypothetical protein B0J14DRAFT_248107 [Halenospora varia]|nr:hypothetical protein B0J14DRAFT_248107 [Halenospora varia]